MAIAIAVTGGLASGKSLACQILKELGADVVSADEIVHRLLTPNTFVGKDVIKLLGNEIVVHHTIDRKKVAEIVFNDHQKLISLQAIIHPAVKEEINKKKAEPKTNSVFVAEIPLLFEVGADKDFDATLCVASSYDHCLQRYLAKGNSKEDFDSRMRCQLPPEEKEKRASWTVHNDGSIQSFHESLAHIYKALTQNTNPHLA